MRQWKRGIVWNQTWSKEYHDYDLKTPLPICQALMQMHHTCTQRKHCFDRAWIAVSMLSMCQAHLWGSALSDSQCTCSDLYLLVRGSHPSMSITWSWGSSQLQLLGKTRGALMSARNLILPLLCPLPCSTCRRRTPCTASWKTRRFGGWSTSTATLMRSSRKPTASPRTGFSPCLLWVQASVWCESA